MYHWLKFGHKVLPRILSRDPDAKVNMPANDEVRFYHETIGTKYPIFDNVQTAADDLKLLIQELTKDAKQNQLFNGWKHKHNINCVFVVSPDGKIRL